MHALDAEDDAALLRRKVEEEAMGLSVGELKNGEERERECVCVCVCKRVCVCERESVCERERE